MEENILIVDDERMNRELLSVFLKSNGYNPIEAEDGSQALEKIQIKKPDLIILDLNMPGVNGFEVLERVKKDSSTKMIPVIVVTGLGDTSNHLRALELGADDFLAKPFNIHFLKARIKSLLSLKRIYDLNMEYQEALKEHNINLMQELIKTQEATIVSLATLAEFRDPETGEHLERIRGFSRVLAETLTNNDLYKGYIDRDYIDQIFKSTPLHDIGKVGIPDSILLKPGKLTNVEFNVMKTHTIIGGDSIESAIERVGLSRSFLDMAAKIAYYHHEKWDGSGYPRGLKGEEIPLSARITAVADVYDALTTERVYKKAFSHEYAREIIVEGSGKHFDPKMVEAFLESENAFFDLKERYKDKGGSGNG